jgi:hypothetical protein
MVDDGAAGIGSIGETTETVATPPSSFRNPRRFTPTSLPLTRNRRKKFQKSLPVRPTRGD